MATMPSTYTLTARTLPMILTVSPLIVVGGAVGSILPVSTFAVPGFALFLAAVSTLLSHLARDAGKRIEAGLWTAWGGAPTTQLLRWREPRPSKLAVSVRHQQLQTLVTGSVELPTAAEEEADPVGADETYEVAVGMLRGLTRDKSRFPLVHKENAGYGFRRNLLGLKRVGVTASVLALLAAPVFVGLGADRGRASEWFSAASIAGVAIVALFLWSRANGQWVRPAACAYAERLLEAAQALAISPGSTGTPTDSRRA